MTIPKISDYWTIDLWLVLSTGNLTVAFLAQMLKPSGCSLGSLENDQRLFIFAPSSLREDSDDFILTLVGYPWLQAYSRKPWGAVGLFPKVDQGETSRRQDCTWLLCVKETR
jgi:hypothetical protein